MLTTKSIIKDGNTLVTEDLQDLIDKASKENEELVILAGKYLTSSIFLHSNMKLTFEEGAILIATIDESKYPILNTRVAGIEMPWYVGILNIIDCSNVSIAGHGIIDGSGEYFWNKYWGADLKGGMRKEYDARGIRWACDYDCMRPRNILVSNSKNISIDGLESKNSGFWNFHILYSNDVLLKNVSVNLDALVAPSTDGIDIDSSYNVTIDNANTSCNDDSICIKSGRDYDGYNKNISCHDITIKNCVIKRGFGITIGSEVSGGVYNINIDNIKFLGTDCGFRIKSSAPRRGYIKNISFNNIIMENVKYLFHVYLDWNPLYSICSLPADYSGEIKPHYNILTKVLPNTIPNTLVDGININNVKAYNTKDYEGISRAFTFIGYPNQYIKNINIKDSNLDVYEYGILKYTEKLHLENTNLSYRLKYIESNDDFDNR